MHGMQKPSYMYQEKKIRKKYHKISSADFFIQLANC